MPRLMNTWKGKKILGWNVNREEQKGHYLLGQDSILQLQNQGTEKWEIFPNQKLQTKNCKQTAALVMKQFLNFPTM